MSIEAIEDLVNMLLDTFILIKQYPFRIIGGTIIIFSCLVMFSILTP